MAIMTIFARTRETTANAVPIALPASPAPAYTTSSARPPLPPATDYDAEDDDDCTDAVDDFFGVTYTREERQARRLRLAQATHASRHDAPVYVSEPVSPVPVVDEKAALPAYATWEKDLENASIAGTLPEYCEAETGPEPFSIPQGLYKWGFCTSSSEYFLFHCVLTSTFLLFPVLPLFWFLGALLLINFHSPTELVPRFTPEESALRVSTLRRAERRWARRCLLAWTIFTFFALATAGVTYGIVMSLKN